MKPRLVFSVFLILAVCIPAAAAPKYRLQAAVFSDPISWVQGVVGEISGLNTVVLDDGTIVVTNSETVFEGLDTLAALAPGDFIEAKGYWKQNGSLIFEAELLTRLHSANSPVVLFGTVHEVTVAEGFVLNDGSPVMVDARTVYTNLNGIADISRGDLLLVGGRWRDDVFYAQSVERISEGVLATILQGHIAVLAPPDSFYSDNGTLVRVNEQTRWLDVAGFDQLRPGDVVVVEGFFDSSLGELQADQLQRISSEERAYVAFTGYVSEIEPPGNLVLDGGVELVMGESTVFDSFDILGELVAGDQLWVEAYTTDEPMRYEVIRLTLLGHSAAWVDFVSVVDEVSSDTSFWTSDGHLVWVDGATALVGFSSLDELQPGFIVAVSGSQGPNPLEVEAEIVTLLDGEDGPGNQEDLGGGLLSMSTGVITNLSPPDRFMLDGWSWVKVTASTEWGGGLFQYEDLVQGLVVSVSLLFADELEALSVAGIGTEPNSRGELQGYVEDINADGELHLSGGEWLLVDAQTVVDGDVNSIADIMVPMQVTADAVDLGGGRFYALSVFVDSFGIDSNPWSQPGGELVASEALVVLQPGADPNVVAERYQAEIDGSLPGMLVFLFRWEESAGGQYLDELMADEEVADVGPNYPFADPESIRRRFSVVDRQPISSKFWTQGAVQATNLEAAHARCVGKDTVVAVIDTGIDPFHPLLRHRVAPGGWDYVDDDPWPWETRDGIDQDSDTDVDESAGHGTFVSGMVLLAAPGATILPFRVLNDDGHGTTFDICRAVLAAMDRGVDVINMSFAYSERPRVLDRILDEASRRGIVLVSGAGNDGQSILPFPANDHRVLAVKATAADGEPVDFSNHGSECTVAAPGYEVYSACAEGEFCTWSGTSMAAPLVSGTAALLRSLNPRLTPEQIRDAIVQSATEGSAGSDEPGFLQVAAAVALIPPAP